MFSTLTKTGAFVTCIAGQHLGLKYNYKYETHLLKANADCPQVCDIMKILSY